MKPGLWFDMRHPFLLLIALVAVACGSPQDPATDLVPSDTTADSSGIFFDLNDTAPPQPDDATVTAADASVDDSCPGGALCPCAANEDCDGGSGLMGMSCEWLDVTSRTQECR